MIRIQKKTADGERFGSILSPSFFNRETSKVARELLGQVIVRQVGRSWLTAKIIETEAYLGEGDPASHSSRGMTPRTKVMFGPPGVIYVYFIYGNYFMLNFVTEREGKAGAVLIRAVEPLEGTARMKQLRGPIARERDLTNGPAKLAMAMGINAGLNARELGLPHLAVAAGDTVKEKSVVVTTRVGISAATDLPLRFYVKGNPFVSKL